MKKILYILLILMLISTAFAGRYVNITSPVEGKLYTADDSSFFYDVNLNVPVQLIRWQIETSPAVVSVNYNDFQTLAVGEEATDLRFQYPAVRNMDEFSVPVTVYDAGNNVLERELVNFTISYISDTTGVRSDAVSRELEIIFTEAIIDSLNQYMAVDNVRMLEEIYQRTRELVEIKKEASILQERENSTYVRIELTPKQELNNFMVIEYIPKGLVSSTDMIEVDVPEGATFEVIDEDPLMVWHFEEVKEKVEVSYTIKKEVDPKMLNNAKTVVLSEEALEMYNENRGMSLLWKVLLPLLVIPVVVFLFLMISRYKLKK